MVNTIDSASDTSKTGSRSGSGAGSGGSRSALAVSVIIPTYNRKEVLRKTLEALEHQTLAPELFEVIVVDDGSSDGTAELVRSLQTSFPLAVEECENGGLAAARNRGLARASHDVVVFLDDDVVPDPDFLTQHRSEHEKADDVAVLGALPFHPDVARSTFLWYLDHVTFFDLYKDPDKYPGGRPPMPPVNGNSSVRRAALEKVGAYDATFRQYGGEELDLGYRLQLAGLKFVYNPDAVGYHYHVKGFEAFCRDQERSGYAVARLADRHPEVREAKRVDLVIGPLSRLSPRKRLLRACLYLLFLFPVPVWGARLLIRLLGGIYPLRRALVPLYRFASHYHYARGIRAFHREGPAG